MTNAGIDDETAPLAPLEATEVEWTAHHDVVVIGLGCAGASAALGAHEAGLDVAVVERAGGGGGASAMSGGLIYLGGGTATQRAAGFDDTPEAMLTFLGAALGVDHDDSRLAAYCADSVAHHDWLVAIGVEFRGAFWPEPGLEPPGDEGLVYSGGEDTAPFKALAAPAPRGHKPRVRHAGGGRLMENLMAAVDQRQVPVHLSTRVERLVVDATGRVVGVTARCGSEHLAIRAERGVVLAAGGFVFNDPMVDRYVPQANRVSYKLGTDGDDGWAIRSGQGVGAALANMDQAEVALPITPPRRMVRGVIVDGAGRRFINEDAYYGRVGHRALFDADGVAYLIVDEPRYEVNRVGLQATWVCSTYEELETEIGLPAGSLVATMAAYNAAAADGHDPELGKDPEWVVPLTEGPFGAFDLRVESTIYASFTLGGLVTDLDGRVLDANGGAVPGLFAAGRTTASLARTGYASGMSLGEGTYFGRRAGLAVAAGGEGTAPHRT